MRDPHTEDRASDLASDVHRHVAPRQIAAQSKRGADGGIEVRAGDRAEEQDEYGQDRAGRQRVAKKRQGVVSAGEPEGHDPGAHHGREQDRRTYALCRGAPRKLGPRHG